MDLYAPVTTASLLISCKPSLLTTKWIYQNPHKSQHVVKVIGFARSPTLPKESQEDSNKAPKNFQKVFRETSNFAMTRNLNGSRSSKNNCWHVVE